MLDYKKPVVIAESDIILLFQLFGFETFNSENVSLDIIIQSIEKDIEQYAILFISSSIILNPKQRKIMNSFTIPISQLPISSDSSSVDELKRLTEKAVGMSLDTLFAS
jgi:vacuolar-type H+-ATPase subunit F/Vma7